MNQIEHNGIIYKVGDTVTVHRKVTEKQGGMGPLGHWDNVWVPATMDSAVGKSFTIQAIWPVGIKFKERAQCFPLLSLIPDTVPLLEAPKKVSDEPFDLKPWMRVKTRNQQMWFVAEHELMAEVRPTNKLLVHPTNGYAYVQWKGEDTAFDIVEVYAPPNCLGVMAVLSEVGKLLWHENIDVEREERATKLRKLYSQRLELDALIQQTENE